MNATITYIDSGAVENQLFSREENDVSFDDEIVLLYIYETIDKKRKVKEVINMRCPNFYSVRWGK